MGCLAYTRYSSDSPSKCCTWNGTLTHLATIRRKIAIFFLFSFVLKEWIDCFDIKVSMPNSKKWQSENTQAIILDVSEADRITI
jgi:hypothetical protein